MELTNEITVALPIDKAWATLTDIEFIAPCMPGAKLTEVHGDEYSGQVSIKVGPITAQYKGTAKFEKRDEATHTAVVSATGRDSRGAGNAAAEITAEMSPAGDGTKIKITTELKVTGKVAQLGRGMMASVSEKLLDQFAQALEAKLESGEGAGSAASEAASPVSPASEDSAGVSNAGDGGRTAPRKINMPDPEPVDILSHTDTDQIKRIAAIAGVILLLLIMRRRRKRRRKLRRQRLAE